MRLKWSAFLSIGFLSLSLAACQTAEIKKGQIICRTSSTLPTPPAEGGKISIAWAPNTEPDLAGYRVYYGTASGSYDTCVDIGNPPKSLSGLIEYTLDGLDKGKKYYIAVIAYDKNQDTSGFSGEVSGVAK
jgi:hypothetical protein